MVKTIKKLNLEGTNKENIKGFINYLYNKGSINLNELEELKEHFKIN